MKQIKCFLFAILSTLAFLLKLSIRFNDIKLYGGVIGGTVIVILFFLFYFRRKDIPQNKLFLGLAMLFGIFMIVGNSLKDVHDFSLLYHSWVHIALNVLSLVGYTAFFYHLISLGYEFLMHSDTEQKKQTNHKFLDYIDHHPFITTCIILFLCYVIYMIAFYPAILSPDPANQIKQFFGMETKYLDSVIRLDESVFLTNHHPVFQTYFIGGCIQLGLLFDNFNLGLFFYTFLQTCALIATLAYTISYMKKLNISLSIRILFLSIYALVPVFPFYAMSMVKDTFFTCFVILYTIWIFDFLREKDFSLYKGISFWIITIFMILFRNNGIHIFLFSFPFLLFVLRKYFKKYLILFVSVILFYLGYQNVFLPLMRIPDGSIREMLSIPFQQTARYVLKYDDEVTNKEKEAIDKILVYESLGERYQENISDPVKEKFNKYATSEDLKDYFLIWAQQFLKHPLVYVEATALNTYGYFYPATTNWYIYYKYDTRLEEAGFDYSYNSLEPLRKALSNYGRKFPKIPILCYLVNIGFGTWMIFLLAIYVLKMKKYYYLPIFLPSILLILVCVASPVNTYYRYAMPYLFSIPVLFSMVKWISKEYTDKLQ